MLPTTYLKQENAKAQKNISNLVDFNKLKSDSQKINNAKSDTSFIAQPTHIDLTTQVHHDKAHSETSHTNNSGFDYNTHSDTNPSKHSDTSTNAHRDNDTGSSTQHHSDHSQSVDTYSKQEAYKKRAHTDSTYTAGDHKDIKSKSVPGEHAQYKAHSEHSRYAGHNDTRGHSDGLGSHSEHSRSTNPHSDSNPHSNRAYSEYSKYVNPWENKMVPLNINIDKPKNFTPNVPELIQLGGTIREDLYDIYFYSYDRNIVSGDTTPASREVIYDVEIQKTSGSNSRGWKTIYSGKSEKVTLNSLDPFAQGWTKASQAKGSYQLRVTPRNKSHVWTHPKFNTITTDYIGASKLINFDINLNNDPIFHTDPGTPWIDGDMYRDGAITTSKGSTLYNEVYSETVAANKRKGIYTTIHMKDNDIGQYQTGEIRVIDLKTKEVLATEPITWGNGSGVISSDGKTVTGFAFIPVKELFASGNRDAQVQLVIKDYRDAGCTELAGGAEHVQNIIGNGNSKLLNLELSMADILRVDNINHAPTRSNPKIYSKAQTVTIGVNQETHMRESYKDTYYEWSTSSTPSSAMVTGDKERTTLRNFETTFPDKAGRYYLHMKLNSIYPETLSVSYGPYIYAAGTIKPEGNVTMLPTIDNIIATSNMKENQVDPEKVIPNKTYIVEYRRVGTQNWNEVNAQPTATLPNMKMQEGEVEVRFGIKDNESDLVIRSLPVTVSIWDMLNLSISGDKGYIHTPQRYIGKIHDTSGKTKDGWSLLTNTPDKYTDLLRPGQHFYYKDAQNNYTFTMIQYFKDTIE